ncbi:Uncharacterized protein APZ42_005969 [Daphnia magna]|uniref:Uncharacterized protein n=1 Tax=Daphnia magna TaxID=35525 RepID=A0A164G5H0_9CRUS|nr:Uncharacterized protein APZ42_005969 [Daphnia magna]
MDATMNTSTNFEWDLRIRGPPFEARTWCYEAFEACDGHRKGLRSDYPLPSVTLKNCECTDQEP